MGIIVFCNQIKSFDFKIVNILLNGDRTLHAISIEISTHGTVVK